MKKEKATPKSSPKNNTANTITPKRPTKLERVLSYLSTGRSLNRFDAEKLVSDHCLHSTMSAIQNGHSIKYQSKTETVPGWDNAPTQVSRYWLCEESQSKAKALIRIMQKRRGVVLGVEQ